MEVGIDNDNGDSRLIGLRMDCRWKLVISLG